MTRPARTTLATAARAGAWALLAAAGAPLAGCSGTATSGADPFERLRVVAERPGAPARVLTPPDPALARIPGDDPRADAAFTPLSALTTSDLGATPPADAPTDRPTDPRVEQPDEPDGEDAQPAAEPDPDDAREALTLYARARQQLADGDATGAIGLLERATILDPDAPAVWRALGDARRSARFENSAGLAYTRAAELGIQEPEALTLAGLHAAERGETARAAGWLLTAVRADPPHADPLIGYVAYAALGGALLDLGHTAAGAEALAVGVEIPRAARVPTNLGREAATVQRRRAPLLTRLGDARLALGDETGAIEAYESARAIPGAPPVQERLIYALRRSGRDAGAALVLLEEVRAGARVTDARGRALAELAEQIRPRTAVAEALAAIDDRGSATRRARLIAARAACLPVRDAARVLARAITEDRALSAPSRQGLIGVGLERLAENDPDDAIRWAASMVERDLSIATDAAFALVRARAIPAGLGARLEASTDGGPAGASLAGELALLHNDRAAIAAALDALENETAPPTLGLRARLAAALGRWSDADDAIAALRDNGSAEALAFALRSAQRFEAALDALPEASAIAGGRPHPVDTLLERSALASLVGDQAGARDALERALDADPRDERIYAAMLALHEPDGPAPDAEALSAAGRRLREIVPDSDLLRTMLGGEMLRRGLTDDAAGVLVPLLEDAPTEASKLDAMLRLWRQRAAESRADENELALVESLASAHPNAPGPVRLLAGGLALAERAEDAVARVDAFESATGSRALAPLRERLVRDALGDAARADRLALDRLAPAPRSIGDSVALAELHARRLAGEEPLAATLGAIRDALAAIPPEAGLTAPQRLGVRNAVTRAAVTVDSVPATGRSRPPLLDQEAARATLDLLAWGIAREIDLAPGVHELRMLLLDREGAATGELTDAAIAAIDQAVRRADASGGPDPVNLERAFLRRAADMLVARDEADRAFEWLAERSLAGDAAVRTGPAAAEEEEPGNSIRLPAFQEWFRLVVISEDAGRGAAFIERLRDAGRLDDAWAILRPDEWDGLDTGEPAEIAYLLALYAPDSDASGSVPSAYLRLALSHNPAHPWAANDLGYTMLEAGGDLAEAERLIEIAYRARPDRANIVDSLGWVRYHRGKLGDTVDPRTGDEVLGAVSLLERAVALGHGRTQQVGEHQAPQGRGGQEARQDLEQVQPRDHGGRPSGGGDPATNLTLRYAIDEAKAANMPKDTIQRAVDKGSGASGGADFETITYEGYGPSGVAIFVEALTDNRAAPRATSGRSSARRAGNMGNPGSVAFMFQTKGQIFIDAGKTDEDTIMKLALEAGAEDVQEPDGDDGAWTVLNATRPTSSPSRKRSRPRASRSPTPRLTKIPDNTVAIAATTPRSC
jgi:YebC/PmpR family DNA-binding regulatory protein